MILHISADPISGQPTISVYGDTCTIMTGVPNPNGIGSVSLPPPAAPSSWRSGSFLGIIVVAGVAVMVSAGFSSYRSSNAAPKEVSAEMAQPSARRPMAALPTSPDRQGQRVEQALKGQAVVTPPPAAPANGAGNPFGLE